MANTKLCSVPQCGKPSFCRGFCAGHHSRFRKYGDVLADIPIRGRTLIRCSVEGCETQVHARGLCNIHYMNYWRRGDPTAVAGTSKRAVRDFIQNEVLPYNGDECLIWPFSRGTDGYGRATHRGKQTIASRVVCELAHGAAPTPKHEAAHLCGNGHLGCVAPLHLRWATSKENSQDCKDHGTVARGEKVGNSKLKEADVRTIVRLKGKVSQYDLAKRFNVSQSHVSEIQSGRVWSWLEIEGRIPAPRVR